MSLDPDDARAVRGVLSEEAEENRSLELEILDRHPRESPAGQRRWSYDVVEWYLEDALRLARFSYHQGAAGAPARPSRQPSARTRELRVP